jgi:mycothiol synthase
MNNELQIRPVPRSQWAAAATQLVRDLPEECRANEQRRLLAELEHDQSQSDGVLAAYRHGQLLAMCRLQFQAGRTGHLWPPVSVNGPNPPIVEDTESQTGEIARRLVEEVVRLAKTQRLSLVQCLLPTDAVPEAASLRAAGFNHVADLLYLVATTESFPSSVPPSGLLLASVQDADFARLAQIVEQTYSGTLDCPALNNARQIGDVLAGYQSISSSGTALWRILRAGNRDVGCLLVAEHSSTMWEIVYLGIMPAARGQGLGLEATRSLQWFARIRGIERLVLAVDAANSPAINLYAKAGFLAWDRRSVFVWSAHDADC